MKSTNPNNPRTTGDTPVAIKPASPPRRLLRGLAIAAVAGFASNLHAAIAVGDSGSGTNTFDATPAAAEWATLNWAGALTDVTDAATMDTAVSALTASSIATTLGESTTNPPSGNVLARRNTALNLLQMRPRFEATKGCLLMATLQNTNSSGNDVTKLQISYDFGRYENATEELEGVRAYYSMTGLAGSWTAIPDLCTATAGSLSTVVTLSSKWAFGAKMYVLWADDNASATDEDTNTIDNASFTINETAPSANILSFDFGAYGPATINGTNITIQVLSPDLTLAPTYTLSAGATCDVASGYSQDFTNPVTFTVTSSDNQVIKQYIVTVLGHPMITPRGDGKTVAVFNVVGSHNWTIPAGVASVEVLVLGGGGSGALQTGGGGAGGLYQSGAFAVTPGSSVAVTVGAGAAVGGNAGGISVFDSLIAYGGAGGNATTGGASGANNQGGAGYAGGTERGGGGGAGEKGDNSWYAAPNNDGGDGVASTITGTSTYYGGGGSAFYNGATGGLGGGGSTKDDNSGGIANPNGVNGLGGGGAPARDNAIDSGAGGSGVVIVAYELSSKTVTTTELVSSDDTSLNGQSVTFTATVKVGGGTVTTATGNYEFKIDGLTVEAAAAITDGVATYTTDTIAPGAHTVTANYSGDATFEVSTASITQTNVTPATTTELVSDDDTSITGQTVLFTATVKVGETVATDATGTIEFKVDGAVVATESVVSGAASYSTSSLAPGAHSIAASYSGDANYLTSIGSLTQTNVTPQMLTFSFPGFGAATIDGNDITITLPPATAVTSLAPTYSHVAGAIGDPASGSLQDFTLPVDYTLTSMIDPLVTTVYTVTVTVPPHPLVTIRGDGYTVVTYSLAGDYIWTVPAGVTAVEVLVVGGGGAGARGGAFGAPGGSPGGGSGGFYSSVSYPVTGGGSVNLAVGAGAATTTSNGSGGSGTNSIFDQIIAYGGQGGDYTTNQGGNQGGYSINNGVDVTAGFLGGTGNGATGGGGAGENGKNGGFEPAYGGAGVTVGITGSPVGYGGGGSAGYDGKGLGHGEFFGGGEGSEPEGTAGTSGVNGLGGGGGGGRSANGGGGGSGTVIIAYLTGGSSAYTTWAGTFSGFTDTNPAHDPDGDGLTNQQEFAFGLDPTTGSSVNPITAPLNKSNHKFSYTRYAASGLTYTVWTSTDLQAWDLVLPGDMTENAGTPNGAGVATVEVTLTNPPVGDKLFVRVQAE